MLDFPAWFSVGCYGGLVCCMLAMAANALYTSLRKRGTTRQLAGAISTCAISALLLLPALAWYNLRFGNQQATASQIEVVMALAYVALCAWLLPLGTTAAFCLYARPRLSTTALRIPTPLENMPVRLQPPRAQTGVVPPFVFRADIPWGWLEYRSGNFMGQRLALKHAVVTLGRDEESDIWLDDEMASRNHAELACDQEQRVYLTDCNSMNGTLLNGEPVRGTAFLSSNNTIEIGAYSFLFVLAERRTGSAEDDDPLARRAVSEPGIPHYEVKPAEAKPQAPITPLPLTIPSQPHSGSGLLSGGPTPLRLPQRQRTQDED